MKPGWVGSMAAVAWSAAGTAAGADFLVAPDAAPGGSGTGGTAGQGASGGVGSSGAPADEDSGCGCRIGTSADVRAARLAARLPRLAMAAIVLLLQGCGAGRPSSPPAATIADVGGTAGTTPPGLVRAPGDGEAPDPGLHGEPGALDGTDTTAMMKRRRAEILDDIDRAERELRVAPAESPDRPAIQLRRARAYSELAVVAEAESDPTLAREARQRAVREYEAIRAAFPSFAKRDEVLFDLGTELVLDKQLLPARQAMLEIIDKYPASPMVPRAYLAFGDMFFDEAAGDPSKLDLAKQAYLAVLKYPPPDNRVYGYASYKLGWVLRNQGNDAGAISAFKRTIDSALQYGEGSARSGGLTEAARKDLILCYVRSGKPDRAYDFLHSVSGDAGAEDTRTTALVLRLGQAYVDEGMTAPAAVVCDDLLRRHATARSCRVCREWGREATTAATSPEQVGAAQRLQATVQQSCASVR